MGFPFFAQNASVLLIPARGPSQTRVRAPRGSRTSREIRRRGRRSGVVGALAGAGTARLARAPRSRDTPPRKAGGRGAGPRTPPVRGRADAGDATEEKVRGDGDDRTGEERACGPAPFCWVFSIPLCFRSPPGTSAASSSLSRHAESSTHSSRLTRILSSQMLHFPQFPKEMLHFPPFSSTSPRTAPRGGRTAAPRAGKRGCYGWARGCHPASCVQERLGGSAPGPLTSRLDVYADKSLASRCEPSSPQDRSGRAARRASPASTGGRAPRGRSLPPGAPTRARLRAQSAAGLRLHSPRAK